MSLLLRIPRKRKEKPLSILQVELLPNKFAKKQSLLNEENANNANITQNGKKRLFTHVLTVEDSGRLSYERDDKPRSSHKRHTSYWENFGQKYTKETNAALEWKILDLTDTSEAENASSFTLNGNVLVKEYIGELTTDPFTTSRTQSGDIVYDVYELSYSKVTPVDDSGQPIRVLTNALDEEWLVASEEEHLEDGFSSDSNRTRDYPETPPTSTEEDSYFSEPWYDTEEDLEEGSDNEEGEAAVLWRTEDLLRQLQRTSIHESSSSSYNSQASSTDFNF
ncbi:hypothetical protein GpartN1_g73.t1 [Galdieria partita]|uniref:Uncharacterized protein n=1 Tax=Galdieria partita TaxID=83374 RepID=A0A9C7PQR5_9RHOD|nr:hypothetical protein GpartN1_g73.t1 [Galdieria partita]